MKMNATEVELIEELFRYTERDLNQTFAALRVHETNERLRNCFLFELAISCGACTEDEWRRFERMLSQEEQASELFKLVYSVAKLGRSSTRDSQSDHVAAFVELKRFCPEQSLILLAFEPDADNEVPTHRD